MSERYIDLTKIASHSQLTKRAKKAKLKESLIYRDPELRKNVEYKPGSQLLVVKAPPRCHHMRGSWERMRDRGEPQALICFVGESKWRLAPITHLKINKR